MTLNTLLQAEHLQELKANEQLSINTEISKEQAILIKKRINIDTFTVVFITIALFVTVTGIF